MTGIIKRITTNYSFRIPFFSAPNWGRELERNFDTIDSVLFAATGFTNVKGIWTYDTDYIAGDRVVDDDDASLWQCLVSHTSPSSGTMSEYRAANPTHWQRLSQSFVNRGQWVTATAYNVNEFVYDDHKYGVVKEKYTSGASYDDDVSGGKIITLVDFNPDLDQVAQAVTDAQTAQAAAELAETNAETAETNAETAQGLSENARDDAQTARIGAESAQLASEDARDEAQQWASNPEDVVVTGGLYSARHYMLKSEDWSQLSEKWANNPEDVVVSGGKFSALHYAEKAADQAALAISVVGDGTQAVRYDVDQGLDTTQKQQGRENIDVFGLQRVQYITASNASFTPLATTKKLRVYGCGGGGGGGGGDGQSAGTSRAATCGGGSGTEFDIWISQADLAETYSVTIGAGGSAGSGSGGGDGGVGGTTIFTDGVRTVTAPGGRGGGGMVATAGSASAQHVGTQVDASLAGGFTGIVSGSNFPTQGYVLTGLQVALSVAGGGSFGSGGQVGGAAASGSIFSGKGYGSGGGGVTTSSGDATNYNGGAGAPGIVIVEEWG